MDVSTNFEALDNNPGPHCRLNAGNGCFMDKGMVPIDQTDTIDQLYRLEVATHDGVWVDFAVLAPLSVRRFRANGPEQKNQSRHRRVWPLRDGITRR